MPSKKFVLEWVENNKMYGNPHTLLTALETDFLEDLAKDGMTKDYRKYCHKKIANIKNMKIALYKLNIYHGDE